LISVTRFVRSYEFGPSKVNPFLHPFKCIVTIQNEDGQTVLWKALKHYSESFKEIQPDLVLLRNWLNRNNALAKGLTSQFGPIEQSVKKVVYVDNCCSVRSVVK
jgi:hypothetical protein